jgi:hypothetical protein
MSENELKKEREGKAKTFENAAIAGANAEVVQRFGDAVKQHLVAFSGVDNETGQMLSKSYDSIAKSKVNSDFKDDNIHQQSGYDAEVAKTARDNAENIIKKTGKRTVRTDDHSDYGKNHPIYDHVEVLNGTVIDGSGSQMKFVNNPKALLDKIACGEGGGKSDLSRYLGAKLDLPSDQINEYQKWCEKEAKRLREQAAKANADEAAKLIKRAKTLEESKQIDLSQYCDLKAQELYKQAERLEREGKAELAAKKRQQAKNYKTVKSHLRDSGISSKEAEFYRLHPKLATAKDILKASHRAGVEQAKMGAVISGGISLIKNLVAVVKGEKKPDEAALTVAKDTGTGAAASYATAFAGVPIKGFMKNSGSAVMRGLSKTNLAGTVVTVTLETGKTLAKYFKGEIDGVACLTELGEKGAGLTASALFGAIGQIAIPLPVVGAMIGSMLGYALSSACYGQLVSALNAAKLAREERIRIEAECAEAVKMIRQYRAEIEADISRYLSEHIATFQEAFDGIKLALNTGDIDGFIAGANSITCKLGGKPQFNNLSEFNSLMESGQTLRL